MTLISADLGHFAAWLAAEPRALSDGTKEPGGDLYPERRIFGDYVAAQLAPLVAQGAVVHHRANALSVARDQGRFRIETSDGALTADLLVLAMTHLPPDPPAPFAALAGSARVIGDPYLPGALDRIGAAERVVILGTGLTSADVVASLDLRGFRGEILAVSRRGLRSRGHAPAVSASTADFTDPPSRTALALLRRVRSAVASEARAGRSWHAPLDRLREQSPEVWRALPEEERARSLARLRVFWDVHRFRIAPVVERRIDALLAEGRLRIRAARMLSAEETPRGIEVSYRPRGRTTDATGPDAEASVSERFDRVVLATGPAHGSVLRVNPALASLAAAGLIRRDPLGLGIATTRHCRADGPDGAPVPGLFVAGPLARGEVGELMGVPEVITHAEAVARAVLDMARTGTF